MTPSEFAKFLERDGGRCLHCGTTEGLVPQHRINRGMGGYGPLEIPSNVIVLCSRFNGLIESDAGQAHLARAHGWKLSSWDRARLTMIPVYDIMAAEWYWLDNNYSREQVP